MSSKSNENQGMISLENFKLFLKFFGPPQNCLMNVLAVYSQPFFHGFARHNEACELLKGKPGHFLFRYSESQLKDGFFAFNVNKGNETRDLIENYSIRYQAECECFVFRNQKFRTLKEFVDDYAKIF